MARTARARFVAAGRVPLGSAEAPTGQDMFGGRAFGSFEFKMTEALIEQVVLYATRDLEWATLNSETLDSVFQGRKALSAVGIYLLGRRMAAHVPRLGSIPAPACDEPDADGRWVRTVYVGQSQSAIVRRLRKHAEFIRDRNGLSDTDVVFKAAEIVIFSSVDVEGRLMEIYGSKWSAADPLSGWQGSGFGSNDTGGNRDAQAISKFDTRFPIDIFRPRGDIFEGMVLDEYGRCTVRAAITKLSGMVPYTVRPAHAQRAAPDLQRLIIPPPGVTTAYDALKVIVGELNYPWVAAVNAVRVVIQLGPLGCPRVDPGAWPPDFAAHPLVVIDQI